MKQTVFKGFINGREFDNVVEYNDYIKELTSKGQPIHASTSTRIEEVNDETPVECCGTCRNEVDKCNCDLPDEEEVNKFPGFERPESYLDVLVTDDPYSDKQTAGQLIAYLEENLQNLDKVTDSWTIEDLETYATDIDECISVFKSDRNDCDQAIKVMLKRREELQKIMNTLEKDQCKVNRGLIIIHAYDQFYRDLQVLVKNKLVKKCAEEPVQCTQCKEPSVSFGNLLKRFLNLN